MIGIIDSVLSRCALLLVWWIWVSIPTEGLLQCGYRGRGQGRGKQTTIVVVIEVVLGGDEVCVWGVQRWCCSSEEGKQKKT